MSLDFSTTQYEKLLKILCFLEAQPELSTTASLELFYQNLEHSEEEVQTELSTEELLSQQKERSAVEDHIYKIRPNIKELDATIQKHSHHWRVSRMSRIDRNILRLFVFEILEKKPNSFKRLINEAVELAKRFGSEESYGFVNAILEAIATSDRK